MNIHKGYLNLVVQISVYNDFRKWVYIKDNHKLRSRKVIYKTTIHKFYTNIQSQIFQIYMKLRKQMKKGDGDDQLRFFLRNGWKVVGMCKKGWYVVRRKLNIQLQNQLLQDQIHSQPYCGYQYYECYAKKKKVSISLAN